MRVDSKDIEACLHLADLYLRDGKQPEAAKILRAVVRTQPHAVEAYRQLAAIYRDAGYPDREYEALRALVTYAPDHWEYSLRLADIALEQRWFDIAEPMLKQAAHTAPREARVFSEQASLEFLRHAWPQMESRARAGLHIAPDNAGLWVALSDACRLQGHLPEAEQALRSAIRHTTEPTIMVRHYARLAHLLLETGWKPARTAEAEQAATTALQRTGDDVEALYWLARAQHIEGRVSEAETNYLRAAKQDIQFEALSFHLGALYQRSPDPNKRHEGERLLALYQVGCENATAFSQAVQVLSRNLSDPVAHCKMAESYLKVGSARQAIMELHRALELDPKDRAARRRLRKILLAEGRTSEAKQYE